MAIPGVLLDQRQRCPYALLLALEQVAHGLRAARDRHTHPCPDERTSHETNRRPTERAREVGPDFDQRPGAVVGLVVLLIHTRSIASESTPLQDSEL